MKNGCQCQCSSNCNKDLIVITIQSGCNNKKAKLKSRQSVADAYSEAPDPDSDSVDTVDSQKSAEPGGNSNRDPSRHSVAVARKKSRQKIYKLPIVCDRHHGPGCAMEICVLEKHEDSCMFKKEDSSRRNLRDDRVGSYDCIGRMVFKTCHEEHPNSRPSILVTPPSRASLHPDRRRTEEFDPDKQIYGGVIADRKSHQSERDRNPSVFSQPSSMRQVHDYNSASPVDEEPVRARSASRTYQAPPRRRQEAPAAPCASNQASGRMPRSTPYREPQEPPASCKASPWRSYGDSGPGCASSSYESSKMQKFGPYRENQEPEGCKAPPWRSYGDSGPGCASSSYESGKMQKLGPYREGQEAPSVPLVFSFNKKTQSHADEANQTPLYFSYIKTSNDSLSSYENLTTKKKYGSGLIAGLFGSSRRKSAQQKNKSKYHK